MLEKTYAPVIVFTYNRYNKTIQTMEALANNTYASETDVYVYSNAEVESVENDNIVVSAIRNALKKFAPAFKSYSVIEREKNTGPNDNMIPAIDEIVNKYGRAIILEDDIVTAKGFLRFMNSALDKYEDEKNIFSICGYNPLTEECKEEADSFAYDVFRSWGWAIWADRWNTFDLEKDALSLIDLNKTHSDALLYITPTRYDIIHRGSIKRFLDLHLAYRQMADKKTVIYSKKSLCDNIGLNGSSVTCPSDPGYFNCNFDINYDKENFELSARKLTKESDPEYFFEFRKRVFIMHLFWDIQYNRDYLYSLYYYGTARLYFNGIGIGYYFCKHNLRNIAVYGNDENAQLFYAALKHEGLSADLISEDDELNDIDKYDIVVITAIDKYHIFEETKFRNTGVQIASADDIMAECKVDRIDNYVLSDYRYGNVKLYLEDYPKVKLKLNQLITHKSSPLSNWNGLFCDIYLALTWIYMNNKDISSYFKNHNIKSVLIYDYGYAGKFLKDMLLRNNIVVSGIVDRFRTESEDDIKIFADIKDAPEADAVLVTEIRNFEKIKEEICDTRNILTVSMYSVVMESLQDIVEK